MWLKPNFFERRYRDFMTRNMSVQEELLFKGLRDINNYAKIHQIKIEIIDPSNLCYKDELERQIRAHCNKTLTQNQFRGIHQCVEDIAETGERYIIKDGKPTKTYQALPVVNYANPESWLTSTQWDLISQDEVDMADEFIECHSHPLFNNQLLRERDVNYISLSFSLVNGKPYHHIIYSPAHDTCTWYKPSKIN